MTRQRAMTLGTRIVVLKDGVIQQVDTPQNLYDRPGNLFVAGFIGSPQMNFIDATLQKEGNNVYLVFGPHKITVTPEKAEKVKDYIGKEVTFGIRPEIFMMPLHIRRLTLTILFILQYVYTKCSVLKYSYM